MVLAAFTGLCVQPSQNTAYPDKWIVPCLGVNLQEFSRRFIRTRSILPVSNDKGSVDRSTEVSIRICFFLRMEGNFVNCLSNRSLNIPVRDYQLALSELPHAQLKHRFGESRQAFDAVLHPTDKIHLTWAHESHALPQEKAAIPA